MIDEAWTAFMNAEEVQPACAAYAALRTACGVDKALLGRESFLAIADKTHATTGVSFRIKQLLKALTSNWETRAGRGSTAGMRVVISGAGPVGLRAAVECALMGMHVTVLEKRSTFSRVNILTLWKQTADDLMAFGAKAFYNKFTNLGDRLHLGTREIQCASTSAALGREGARAAEDRRFASRSRAGSCS